MSPARATGRRGNSRSLAARGPAPLGGGRVSAGRRAGPVAALAGLGLIASLVTVAARADVPATQRSEVAHLLEFVRRSGCAFERNGRLHAAEEAAAHLQRKYDHFRKEIDSTERFVELAASRSELTGRLYLVRCGTAPPQPVRDWLLGELTRYRRRPAP